MTKRPTPQWFDKLLPGPWYRGIDATGKGVGVAYMGEGFYLTWSRGVAEAFAELAVQKTKKGPSKVQEYKLVLGKGRSKLKLLDNRSALMSKIKRELGVEPWDKIDDPLFSQILTGRLQEEGVDGVIDSNPADGLVVFDRARVIEAR